MPLVPFPLSPCIHPTNPLQMAYILLFSENMQDLVVLTGEKERAPDVSTLIGGKVGDEPTGLNEWVSPWIAVFRELAEETGHPIELKSLTRCFDLTTIHKDEPCLVHVFSGLTSQKEIDQAQPPCGTLHLVNINSLNPVSLDNDGVFLSPMHNHIVQCYKNYNRIHAETAHVPTYHAGNPFISISDFQTQIKQVKSLRSLAQHPA